MVGRVRSPTRFAFILLVAFLTASPTLASDASHDDPVAPLALALTLILVFAKLGGDLAIRLGQPAVLGELLVGVVLGNVHLAGLPALNFVSESPFVDMLARLGVLLLLFEVGLESTIAQMMKVGVQALLVALLGVVAPFALGWGMGAWLLPDHSVYAHAFLGATLCATSVGITARVLRDLNRSQSPESRIILGAAVVDDVLGLVVLAVVSGIIAAADAGGAMSYGAIGFILFKAAGFLIGALFVGALVTPRLFRLASRLRSSGVLLALGLAFCFLLAWLANLIGLAPIVGAFAAGLILEELHFRDFQKKGEASLEHLIHPISAFLVPIFFVLMGMRTDLRAFLEPGVLALAGALTVAAIIGKQACSLGVIGPGVDKLSVGLGMVPRGEVGLIFANIGAALTLGGERVIDNATFSAVVVMVIVTTMFTPPALKWSLARYERRRADAAHQQIPG
jgi:Kef-type K+ transport system membrane component KefB